MIGMQVTHYSPSACPQLRWPEIVSQRPMPSTSPAVTGCEVDAVLSLMGPSPQPLARLLRRKGGDRFPISPRSMANAGLERLDLIGLDFNPFFKQTIS